ncbi:unnamed protein product, partial [Symbiodinium sp. CCMP2456]
MHEAALAAVNLSRQENAHQKDSGPDAARVAAQDAFESFPEVSSQPPVEASRPKPKAAAVKTSSVWDTDSNSIPAPTELLFDPLPEVARKEVYATFDREHGGRHDWDFDGDEAKLKDEDGVGPSVLVSAETASTGILRWCIKSQGGDDRLIIGIIPAEEAEKDMFLYRKGGYHIKYRKRGYGIKSLASGCDHPEFDIYKKYIEVIADLDTRVAK